MASSCCVRNLMMVWFSCFLLFMGFSYSQRDTLLQGQKLINGGQLLSAFGVFKLGFFDRGSYVGIWYHGEESWDARFRIYSRVPLPLHRVWVANPVNPIDKSGVLAIGNDGNLKIFCSGRDPIALTSVRASGKTSVTLLDTGNLVLRELNSDGSIKQDLWQSFDYPTRTLLPGMKLGINLRTGHSWYLRSGSFTFGMDNNGTNELIIRRRGDTYWASGIWINGRFNLSNELCLLFKYVSNEDEKYFTYYKDETDPFPKMVMEYDGSLSDSSGTSVTCNHDYQFSVGCVTLPLCRKQFPQFDYISGTVSGDSFRFNESQKFTRDDCEEKCKRNCSCVAYGSTNVSDDTGCQIWTKVKIRTSEGWRGIYIIKSEVIAEKKSVQWLIIAIGGAAVFSTLCFIMWSKYKASVSRLWNPEVLLRIWRKCMGSTSRFFHSLSMTNSEQEILLSELGINRKHNTGDGNNSHELQFFNFESIALATNNFAPTKMLGEGGFGPVYKGKLPDGQEVAIKRLSTNSRQGLAEFKNEVKVIGKLQHNNLVRLVGCCIDKEEKILIYEYMPNKSLDFFLFDDRNHGVLDWKKRFNIIEGIVQGLLYLHKYSRLKIIHRDLKASNVLLDSDMNPKISDFGMAKIFGADESKANTNRVVGTFGYMSPEYAIEGVCSTKSDVFSFGVLLLEIVSGRRNNSFHQYDGPLNLTVYAWDLWRQGRGLELIEPELRGTYENEVLRCFHVGLLCIQENPTERPTMLEVASMIYSDTAELPCPKQPAFCNRRNLQATRIEEEYNEMSITDMEGR